MRMIFVMMHDSPYDPIETLRTSPRSKPDTGESIQTISELGGKGTYSAIGPPISCHSERFARNLEDVQRLTRSRFLRSSVRNDEGGAIGAPLKQIVRLPIVYRSTFCRE